MGYCEVKKYEFECDICQYSVRDEQRAPVMKIPAGWQYYFEHGDYNGYQYLACPDCEHEIEGSYRKPPMMRKN